MKKIILVALLAVFTVCTTVLAADFPITANIPAATKVLYKVSMVTPGNPPTFVAHLNNNLNFKTAGEGMKYNDQTGVWAGSRFWAIDLSPSTINDDPAPATYGSITFAYAANVVPAGQAVTEGLNKRATLTAVKVVGVNETQLRNANIGSAFAPLTNADVAGGFLRVYVGLATGEKVGNPPVDKVPGSVPFTNADKPGDYTGTLTITATLI